MTIDQFDEIIGYLVQIVLPPRCNNDPPISAEQVGEVLERHLDAVRGTIIRNRIDQEIEP